MADATMERPEDGAPIARLEIADQLAPEEARNIIREAVESSGGLPTDAEWAARRKATLERIAVLEDRLEKDIVRLGL